MERDLRASFTGYYGMRNFGDDLFGAICAAASRRFWNAKPRVVGPAIATVDSLYTMPGWYPPAVYGGSGLLGKTGRLYSFLRGVRNTDLLVMGGGSVINGRGSFREPLMLSAQRRGRLKLAAIGVSVGPFEDAASQESAKAFISRLSYLAVRDRRSYELALEMGVGERLHRGRDLAGLLSMLLPPSERPRLPAQGEKLRIGVAPCRYSPRPGYSTPEAKALQDSMVEALKALSTRYRLQVEIFSLNGHSLHGDREVAQTWHRALAAQGVLARQIDYLHCDPIATAQAIGECDAFISTRLHGAIVAYMVGVPFMLVDYHPKCADFADDIGLPASRRITAQHNGAAAIADGLEAMLGGEDMPGLSHEDYAVQAREIFRRAPWAVPVP